MLSIFGGIGANVFGQKLLEVFDGRERFPGFQEPTDKDGEFFLFNDNLDYRRSYNVGLRFVEK